MNTTKGRVKMVTELVDCANSFAVLGQRLENILFKWSLQTMAGDKDIEPFLEESGLFDILESDK
jgi:hypothetical protein